MLVELKQRLRGISDLNAAGDVLNWDQATYMPEGGAGARGRQRAMLNRLAHERAVEPALGRLIDALARYGESLPHDSDDASLIRVACREYQKKIKIPPDHVARATAHSSASYDAWTRARPANDFATVVPYLERTLDLSREYSSHFAPYKQVADPHIDDADEGMTTASTRTLFDELKRSTNRQSQFGKPIHWTTVPARLCSGFLARPRLTAPVCSWPLVALSPVVNFR
jgi:carboxypeptidase Taq